MSLPLAAGVDAEREDAERDLLPLGERDDFQQVRDRAGEPVEPVMTSVSPSRM